jgi:integrase
VRRELVALNAALRWHDKNTLATIELPTAPAPRDRHLKRNEFDRLIASATTDHVRLFIRLALVTAARKTALLTLTWRAVDFTKRQINLGHVQGGKGRAVVPITDATMEWLDDAYQRRTTDWVIEWNGERVRYIRRSFTKTASRAGLSDVTPHDLRHTAAVWMAESGVSMAEIGQYLGHTDLRTTYRIYARFSPDYLRGAAEALDVRQ